MEINGKYIDRSAEIYSLSSFDKNKNNFYRT